MVDSAGPSCTAQPKIFSYKIDGLSISIPRTIIPGMLRISGIIACLISIYGWQCYASDPAPLHSSKKSDTDVPAWAQEAIWYQIFVERFRNGDSSNDPALRDMKGASPKIEPDGWRPTPWTQDWYKPDEWAERAGLEFYDSIYLRRYGGDIQGVIQQLDYLQDLGITALYLNPVNDAPSLHKFDARNYRHVDRNFGPDPRGDAAMMALETPENPSTWQWTAADRLFLRLVDEVHRRGMRVILDYSWNHTGVTFWAWKDVVENQDASEQADWYQIERFDNPATRENEFKYRGWAGVTDMPALKKVGVPDDFRGGPVEGNLHPDVKRHVFAVTRRWLDPNGDGDPSDGIDGFRLDVADVIPLGFWREYRQFVRSINPDAYMVGEVWWERWPDRMMDPRPYLGDVFDAVMNYRWYMPTRSFFADALPRMSADSYVAHLDSIESDIDRDNLLAMMNLTASHDSPRFSTSVYNPGPYKVGVYPRDNPAYRVNKPDARAQSIQKLILVQQFTYYGAPHIWNGDEVGMWGADDPDNRKPLVWADLEYEDEIVLPDGTTRAPDSVEQDTAMFNFYKKLIALRKRYMDLFVRGALTYSVVDDANGLLAYSRTFRGEQAVVAFNKSDRNHTVMLHIPTQGTYIDMLKPGTAYRVKSDSLLIKLGARDAVVLIRTS